jgi:hypothetical protein
MNALPGLRFRLVDVFVDYRQRQDPHVHANGPRGASADDAWLPSTTSGTSEDPARKHPVCSAGLHPRRASAVVTSATQR